MNNISARTKLLIGTLLLLCGGLIPSYGSSLTIIGVIISAIGVYELRQYNDNFWKYYVLTYIGIIMSFVGAIIVVSSFMTSTDLEHYSISNIQNISDQINFNDINFPMVIVGYLIIVIGFVLASLYKYKFLKEFYLFTKLREFNIARKLLLIGVILLPLLVGIIFIIFSLFIEVVGYYKMRSEYISSAQ